MKKGYFLGVSEEGFHRVAYTEWGNTNSKPIICVHGLTRNGRDFDYLAEYLSQQDRHVYCPDIVGRGDSDWLKNPAHYTYEQYLADMTALIARTSSQQVAWIGTSMGGLIGMFMAALPSSPIKALVLNDVGAQIPVSALHRIAKYAGSIPDFTSLDTAKKYFKVIYGDFGSLTEEQWDRLTINSVREIAPGKYISKIDRGITLPSAKSKLSLKSLLNPHKALEGTVFDIDLWDFWYKVSCPVLVIRGARSDILPTEILKKMQATHKQMTVIEVANAGHAPALVEQEQMIAIDEWLKMNY